MADGDTISVELTAKIDRLTSGLSEATNAIRSAAGGMSEGFKGAGEAAEKSESLMKGALSGAIFLEFKEIATEALHSVQEAFEATVGKAEEFGLSNEKFARMMHVSETEAAGMSAALQGVGSSAGAYESTAFRLQKTLQTSTTVNKELADSLKGTHGEELTGVALMDRLKTVLASYSEEGQNAAVVQLGLGRRASDLYDIMRVGHEQVERQVAIYEQMGVATEGAGANSRALEDNLTDLHTMFSALGLAIGQQLMPMANALIEWLESSGPQIKAFGETVVVVAKKVTVSLASIVLGFQDAYQATKVSVLGITESVKSLAASVWDSATSIGAALMDAGQGADKAWADLTDSGDRTAKSLSSTEDKIKSDWRDAMTQMTADGQAFQALLDKIGDETKKNPEEGTGERHGTKASPGVPGRSSNSAEQMAMEKIHAAERMQLALIALQEQTDAHILAMGRESIAMYVAQQTDAENETYRVKSEALDKELALHHKKPVERQKILDQMVALEQEHQGKINKIEEESQSKYQAIAQKQLSDSIRDDNERLQSGMAAIQREYAAGQIGALQKADAEMALTATIKQQELARLDAEIDGLVPGTLAYEAAYKQREKIVRDFDRSVGSILADQRKNVEKDVGAIAEPMAKEFNSGLNKMILDGKSFAESMKSMARDIATGFLEMVEKMAEKWAILQITNAILARTTQGALAVGQIQSSAAVAAAAAYAATVGIPVIGLAAAPGAAAEAMGSVLAFESMALPSAAGGMVLNEDRLLFAHKQEMVLPADISNGMRNLISGGGGNRDIAMHYHPTINAPEQMSLGEMLRTQGNDFMAWLTTQSRNGALRGITG